MHCFKSEKWCNFLKDNLTISGKLINAWSHLARPCLEFTLQKYLCNFTKIVYMILTAIFFPHHVRKSLWAPCPHCRSPMQPLSSVLSVQISFASCRTSYWRRQWQPTLVLLPGKSHGRRSLAGYSPWGREELDTTDVTSLSLFTFMHWRRKCQPTPVFLPGESQGQDPGGLPSMGSHRVGHNSRDLAAAKLLINGAYSMRMCSGFTMLCYFLLYSKVNWLRMCVCVYISPLF